MKNLVYKPKSAPGNVNTISKDCRSPILSVKFCTLVKPFYYSSSPTIARYSICCVIDPKKDEQAEFLNGITCIEKSEHIPSILKPEMVKYGSENVLTDKMLIKFQSKEPIPIYVVDSTGSAQKITLEGEFEAGENVMVVYDILRYTVKKPNKPAENGISFKPKAIYLYPSANTTVEEALDGKN